MNDSIRRLEKKEKGKKPTGEKITGGCDGLAKFNKNQFPHHWVVIMFKWNILQGHEKDLNYRCIFFFIGNDKWIYW